ncbi:pre-mRNA processing factor 3-domain-containing protein [Scenedesmus sp. NREL 46B-D3]|nr:pre-mRNA processing factor 3-domain-containing protein [Scenedesmus sp. NREL 46B-D3]
MARPGKDAAAHRRRRGALEFVEEGSMARQAEIMRLKQKYGEADFKKHLPSHLRRPPRGPAGPAERDANLTPLGAPPIPGLAGVAGTTVVPGSEAQGANSVPIGIRQVEESEEDRLRRLLPEAAAPPEVEWWDKPLLVGGVYFAEGSQHHLDESADGRQQQHEDGHEKEEQQDDNVVASAPNGSGAVMRVRLGKVTMYVEHPVPMEPPAAGQPPPPQPLKLTKKELKKMRTQRRQAREKEKQELIRQGLLEPPKPKVKISNLMRVLGEEATLDPTAIEQEVRRQMGERQAAHDDRNLARMLTPAERRDKKLRKLFDSSPGGALTTRTAVYRVEDLSHGQHRFKVDMNARENHMSGIMLLCPGTFNLVVVEGCPKSLKRYHKLMLRRIDWNATPLPQPGDEEEDAADALEVEACTEIKPPNSCHLVWEGEVGSASFNDFSKEEVASPEAARKLLDEQGVAHYWDAAANYDFEAAPLAELP